MKHTLNIIKLRFERTWWIMLALSAIGTLAAAVLWHYGLFGISDSELAAYDSGLQAWTEGGPISKDVVIVAIDDQTFAEIDKNPSYRREFGSWPYARSIWARIFKQLADDGARAIVFDAVLTESNSDPSNDDNMVRSVAESHVPLYVGFAFSASGVPLPKVEAKNRLPEPAPPKTAAPPAPPPKDSPDETFPGTGADETFPGTGGTAPAAGGDETFPGTGGTAPAEGGDEAFPGTEGDTAAPAAKQPTPEQLAAAEKKRLEEVAQALAFPVEANGITLPELPDEPSYDVEGKQVGTRKVYPNPPMAALLPVCPGFGMVAPERDGDGKIRTTRFAFTDGANTYVTLSVALVADLFKADKVVLSPGKLKIGPREIPINADGSAGIDFGGTLKQRFKTYSLIHVLNDFVHLQNGEKRSLDPALFKDKVVLIGGFAAGTSDDKATPLQKDSPGVMKHAAEIDSLLSGGFIVEAPFWSSVLLTFAMALFSAMVILIVKQPLFELVFPIAIFFLFYLLPGYILVEDKLHVLSAMPGMAGSFASLAAAAFNHFFADEDRELLRETFGRYMEKSLVDQMVEGKKLPPLDGVNTEMTAFFSDIRGFTTFSERFRDDPKQLMKILNTYLTRVTNVLVNQEKATLDKYVGDSVIALFSAPLEQPDHAARACRAALAVQQAVGELRNEFREKGWPDVYTRIGLNTGTMMVGNLGSEQLVDYTAIGDEMNLASRLEAVNKHYETLIMLGPKTYEAAKDLIEAREVNEIRVEGRKAPVRIYELLAMRGWLSPEKQQILGLYAKALGLYRMASFAEALRVLADLEKLDPADGPAKTLRRRCELYLKTPPAAPFDGVTNLTK